MIISIAAGLFAIYTGITAIWIAHIGSNLQITQLEADGASQLIITIACGLGAGLVLWRKWFAFAAFVLASICCVFIAVDFLDDTTWIWLGATAILSIWSLYAKRRHAPSASQN
jgi:hypothetical protein